MCELKDSANTNGGDNCSQGGRRPQRIPPKKKTIRGLEGWRNPTFSEVPVGNPNEFRLNSTSRWADQSVALDGSSTVQSEREIPDFLKGQADTAHDAFIHPLGKLQRCCCCCLHRCGHLNRPIQLPLNVVCIRCKRTEKS